VSSIVPFRAVMVKTPLLTNGTPLDRHVLLRNAQIAEILPVAGRLGLEEDLAAPGPGERQHEVVARRNRNVLPLGGDDGSDLCPVIVGLARVIKIII
jgi:hypothetical protein